MMYVSFALLSLSACEEQFIQRSPSTVGGKTIGGGGDHPGNFKPNNGESYAFPEITYQEFIPAYEPFSHTKCKTWRIEWPWYDSDYDFNLIPGVLSMKTGDLNSFNLLNSQDPDNTFNSTISLFYGNRVEGTRGMWNELDHTFGTTGYDDMDWVQFIKGNVSVDGLQNMVENRPSLFETYWPGAGAADEMDYQEGDFIYLKLWNPEADTLAYGGVRIVSMQPRIIEVYLAVDND